MIPPLPVIFAWPLVVLVLFKRLSPAAALCWSIVAAYLLLPATVRFNLPLLPAISKDTIPVFACLLAVLLFVRGRPVPGVRPGVLPQNKTVLLLMIAFLFSGTLTALTNADTLIYGELRLDGLRPYDALASIQNAMLTLIPLLLARKYLSTAEDHKTLLRVLCTAGAAYAVLILFEVIMSPQLNNIVYGFFPSSWQQHLRSGGYRPLVFLKHGLWLAIFTACAFLAALGYMRASPGAKKLLMAGTAAWLCVILLLSNSLGAALIALVLAPVLLFLNVRLQLICAAMIAGSVLFYPALRSVGAVPTDMIGQMARDFDPNRGASLQYRFNNEDILLDKANQRPLFGWGGWARARVYDEEGRDQSTTDGRWIIMIGEEGWFGYIASFGLLCLPTIFFALRARKYDITVATSALCLVLAANLVDMILNGTLTPITWLVAGALLGRLEVRSSVTGQDEAPPEAVPRDRPNYSRRPAGQPLRSRQAQASGSPDARKARHSRTASGPSPTAEK